MLQNPCKTLGFKKNMVYKIPPGGEVNHIQPVAYKHNTWPRTTHGKVTKTINHHIQESQEVNPFSAGGHKAAMNRQESMTHSKHK